MNTKFNDLTIGNILGETNYYIVEKVVGNEVQLKTDSGSIVVDRNYVEKYLDSAEQFGTAEEITKTQLANAFITNPRKVMTVTFYKQDKPKTQKVYKEELAAKAEAVKNDFLNRGVSAIIDGISNPVLKVIPGELRIMKGRHDGNIDEFGRIQFTDMEATDGHLRTVDPRTIESLVVNNIKYIIKK